MGWRPSRTSTWRWRKSCLRDSDSYLEDMKIKAIIHSAEEGGFWAEVPALPGCHTQGETIEEIEEKLKEAISLWLEAGEPEHSGSESDRIIEVAV